MSVSALGPFTITVIPQADNPQTMSVVIGADSRKDVVSNLTNPGETVDQFGIRVRSMLRALLNGEPKILPAEQITAKDDKPKNWNELKKHV